MGMIVVFLEQMHMGMVQLVVGSRKIFYRETGTGYHPQTEEVISMEVLIPLGEYINKICKLVVDYVVPLSILGLSVEFLQT